MKLKRGLSRFWSAMFKIKLARARMPFWRVVVEAELDRDMRRWPRGQERAVVAVYVWAQSIEEAEGLAALALENEGMIALTADALKCQPAAAPRREPGAVARGRIGYLPLLESEPGGRRSSSRSTRA